MLFVNPLSTEERETLENMKRYHPSHVPRVRAQAVLLSAAGYNLKELSAIFNVCRQSTSTWLTAWERDGIVGLLDKPRSGRPCKLTGKAKNYVIDIIEESPRSLKTVLAKLAEMWNIPVSISTHTSNEFKDNIDRWKEKKLTILPIAPYSPELNLIEILWRKIKYEWMSFSAYSSFHSLKQNLFDILANIGKNYCIKFA